MEEAALRSHNPFATAALLESSRQPRFRSVFIAQIRSDILHELLDARTTPEIKKDYRSILGKLAVYEVHALKRSLSNNYVDVLKKYEEDEEKLLIPVRKSSE